MQEIQEKILPVDLEAEREWAGVENLLDDSSNNKEEKDADDDDKIAGKDIEPVKNINTMGAVNNLEPSSTLLRDVEETKSLSNQ